jgi:hypothetical protein
MSLDYHKEIFSELYEDDGLLIMSKGLGIHSVFLNFLKVYCHSKELVFVLNVSPYEQELLIEELTEFGIQQSLLPKRISNEYTAQER